MGRVIMCYSLGQIAPALRLKFNHELYGYTDRSNSGKYIYEREGILKKGTFERPIKGVIIFDEKDLDAVVEHMNRYGAKYEYYHIKD